MRVVEVCGMMVREDEYEQAVAEAKADYAEDPEFYENLDDAIDTYVSRLAYSED